MNGAADQLTSTGIFSLSGPYKFLDYFTDSEADQRCFAGREREVRELLARITNQRVLVLYGRSGVGKTSLGLAGIFPALRHRGYRPVYVRTLSQPLADLRHAIATEYKLEDASSDGELRQLVARAADGGPLVVVFDQFEEFFVRFREEPEQRSAFVEAVMELVHDASLDLTVVFSLRDDYLAELDEFGERLPELFSHRYRLRPLTAFGVRQAISRPLIASGIPYEDAIVSRLLDLLDNFGFDPPVVQIICSELYKEAARRVHGDKPRIELQDLERIGGLEGIFRRYLDAVTAALPAERHLLARLVLDALITRDDTKQAATLKELLHAEFQAEATEVEKVLGLLIMQRLVRRQEREGEVWYELIHERLVQILRDWLDLDREFFEFRQARAFVKTNSESELWHTNPDALLNAGVLTGLVGPHQDRFLFDHRELEFLFRSAVYRQIESVSYWAERLGLSRAGRSIETLMGSKHPGEREGAAVAASQIECSDRDLGKSCLDLALEDPEERVRRAAGLSLAKLASQANIEALRLAVKRKSTRTKALDALTNLHTAGHTLREFSWIRRDLTRWKVRRRTLRECRETCNDRLQSGTINGMFGAIIWTLPWQLLILSLLSQQESSLGLLALIGGAALFGAILGGFASRAGAYKAALQGQEGSWSQTLLTSPLIILWALLLGFFSFSLTSEILTAKGHSHSFGQWIFCALIIYLGLAFFVYINRPCLWPRVSTKWVFLWGVVASYGLPVLLPALTALAMMMSAWQPIEVITVPLLAAIPVISFSSCVACIAMARSADLYPFGEASAPSPRSVKIRRLLAISALLANFIMIPYLVWRLGN
ncbi:MAG: ATP-binding protein [bacterium]|nr:ATP-binding protein [bacterium]